MTDVWLKTHVYTEGHFMRAVVYMAAAGNPEVLRFSVDMRPIRKAVMAYHRKLHESAPGCVGCDSRAIVGWNPIKSVSKAAKSVTGTVKSVAKSKLLKKVYSGTKSVLRSKYTAGAVAATGLVFPPVGVPAAAAYATANAALVAAENGEKLLAAGNKLKSALKSKNPVIKKAAQVQLSVLGGNKAQLSKLLDDKKKAATFFAAIKKMQAFPPGTPQRLQGDKMAAIVRAVQESRVKAARIAASQAAARAASGQKNYQSSYAAAMRAKDAAKKAAKKAAAGQKATQARYAAAMRAKAIIEAKAPGLPGLVIDEQGRILPGRWDRRAALPGKVELLYQGQGKLLSGDFNRVSGSTCVGCGIWS